MSEAPPMKRRRSARNKKSTASIASYLSTTATVMPILTSTFSAPQTQIPTTSNWAPVLNGTRTTSAALKMKRLGRAKMKRDRILQAKCQETQMQNKANVRQLEVMLSAVNKRITQLQGAAVLKPTAKQVRFLCGEHTHIYTYMYNYRGFCWVQIYICRGPLILRFF